VTDIFAPYASVAPQDPEPLPKHQVGREHRESLECWLRCQLCEMTCCPGMIRSLLDEADVRGIRWGPEAEGQGGQPMHYEVPAAMFLGQGLRLQEAVASSLECHQNDQERWASGIR
jgi:hypothetical protein